MKRIIIALAFLVSGGALASGIDQLELSKDERKPMRVIQTTPLQFPQRLLLRGVTAGAARVAIAMDNTGALTDVLVVGYSHEEFAEAAEQAARAWSYEPMRLRDESVATQATLTFNFEAKGAVVSIDISTELAFYLPMLRAPKAYRPCPLEKLDAIPTPIAFVEPGYGKDLKLHGVQGQAVVEFYIDESGSVRVPAVIEADFWELGTLAMEAVRQWRFDPPTSKGRPVLVRVRQAFVFGRDDA